MKYFLFITFILISSCGQDYLGKRDDSIADIGNTLNLSSIATVADESNARQICSALRSKRLKVISAESMSVAIYDLRSVTCDGSVNLGVASVKFLPNLTLDNLSSTLPYENYLQTDERGPLQAICDAIYKNNPISIIEYISEISVKQISLASNSSFYILYGSKKNKADIEYKLTQKIEYMVGNDSSKPAYGHITKFKETNSCANKESTFIREQVLK